MNRPTSLKQRGKLRGNRVGGSAPGRVRKKEGKETVFKFMEALGELKGKDCTFYVERRKEIEGKLCNRRGGKAGGKGK